ncbi:MAG: hypothetical protein ABSE93_17630 [Terriglobia bacterium]
MRSTLALLTILVVSLSLCARPSDSPQVARAKGTAAHTGEQSLPLRRVILYSNGVAYFERRGQVTGHAEINLSFKDSQMDDVLKSLIVLDLGHGQIGAVNYTSSAPLSARLGEIPFSIAPEIENSNEGGLAGVLRQLQGAHVTVATANRTATGAILTVEDRTSQLDADKPPEVNHWLVLASEAGELASFNLAEVRSVRVLEESARQSITNFAEATASARRRGARNIVVTSDGSGPREMVVSYTVAAPIWKTTYRLVLDASGKPFFQGWAVVDNVSDEDWRDINLALVSGSPVSFIQPIQQPLYRHRPVVPIPEDLQLNPQTYEAAVGSPGGVAGGMMGGIGSGRGSGLGPGEGGGVGGGVYSVGGSARAPANGPTTTLSDAITSEDSGVKSAATGSEVGDFFEYKIDRPVTVLRGQSVLIPILQTRMEAESVSIYNQSARADRPMSGLRLKNTSALTLEDGSLTVIEDNAYAGEALMERLKPGEERFISYALDLGTLVSTRSQDAQEPAFLVRVSNGVFQAHYYRTQKEVYALTNQTDKARVVYVEHAQRPGWRLADETRKPDQVTASGYRFRVELGPHATVQLPVSERQALMDTYALSNLTPRTLELFISSPSIVEATRTALEKVLEIKSRISAAEARLAAAEHETAEIAKDQDRLRENIKALEKTPEGHELIARYVAKAEQQETRIEQLTNERRTANDERAHLQGELDAAFQALGHKAEGNSANLASPAESLAKPGGPLPQ